MNGTEKQVKWAMNIIAATKEKAEGIDKEMAKTIANVEYSYNL